MKDDRKNTEFPDGRKLTIFIGDTSPYGDCLSVGAFSHPREHGEIADAHLTRTQLLRVVTLSDAYVTRIRRRIAEQIITPEDVAVYGQLQDKTWKKIEINSFGMWDPGSEIDLGASPRDDVTYLLLAASAQRHRKLDKRVQQVARMSGLEFRPGDKVLYGKNGPGAWHFQNTRTKYFAVYYAENSGPPNSRTIPGLSPDASEEDALTAIHERLYNAT